MYSFPSPNLHIPGLGQGFSRFFLERHRFKDICGGLSKVKISKLVFTHDESFSFVQMKYYLDPSLCDDFETTPL
jgi:hypothetical protein